MVNSLNVWRLKSGGTAKQTLPCFVRGSEGRRLFCLRFRTLWLIVCVSECLMVSDKWKMEKRVLLVLDLFIIDTWLQNRLFHTLKRNTEVLSLWMFIGKSIILYLHRC